MSKNQNGENTMGDMSPEAIEAAIKEAEANAAASANGDAAAPKVKKPKMATCPACGNVFELPVGATRQGLLAGIAVEDMTEDQLRIERRNAHSVWYKSNKKDPASEGTKKSLERLQKVEAIMEAKGIAVSVRKAATVEDIAALIKGGAISLEDLNALLQG